MLSSEPPPRFNAEEVFVHKFPKIGIRDVNVWRLNVLLSQYHNPAVNVESNASLD